MIYSTHSYDQICFLAMTEPNVCYIYARIFFTRQLWFTHPPRQCWYRYMHFFSMCFNDLKSYATVQSALTSAVLHYRCCGTRIAPSHLFEHIILYTKRYTGFLCWWFIPISRILHWYIMTVLWFWMHRLFSLFREDTDFIASVFLLQHW